MDVDDQSEISLSIPKVTTYFGDPKPGHNKKSKLPL